jgi:hypothetical protein
MYDAKVWCKDRADTATQVILGSYQGNTNVLNLGIKKQTEMSWDPSGFTETEGYKTNTGLAPGGSYVSGQLYIPGTWKNSTTAFQSVGLWATLGTGSATAYPIVNFYNGGPSGGQIRYWNYDHYDVADAPINYDGWNTLRVNYIPGPTVGTGAFAIVVNGVVVAHITGGDFIESPIDPATNSQYEIILNAHTNGVSAYDTYWSNILWSSMVHYNEEYTAASLLPTTIAAGDLLLGTYVDRRGLDWDQDKASWLHAVGGASNFLDGNGMSKVNLKIGGVQYGLDLLALGDPSTRAGITFGYSQGSSTVSLPGGGSAGSTNIGAQPSVGAYLTHSDSAFYADVLGQYRFLNYGVTGGSSTGSLKGGSTEVTAEAGYHMDGGGNIVVTPFAQLVYQHVALGNGMVGPSSVTFDDVNSLIGRARVLVQAKAGSASVFGSVGVSNDFMAPQLTTVSGTTYRTTTGGPRGEFTAGLEGMLAGGFSIFGSGEYDISFDGQSQTYSGRAGFRKDF